MIRNLGMPHGAQQDGVGRAQQIQSIRRHHAPVAEIMVGSPVEIVIVELELVQPAGLVEHALGLRDHLHPHAVARDHRNMKRLHGIFNGSAGTRARRMLVYEGMKGQLKVSTPAQYIAKLEEPRKTEVVALDALIRKTAPKLAPFVHSGVLAYGPWRYKYASGREGDWFRIGVASNQELHFALHLRGRRERVRRRALQESVAQSQHRPELRAVQTSQRPRPGGTQKDDPRRRTSRHGVKLDLRQGVR